MTLHGPLTSPCMRQKRLREVSEAGAVSGAVNKRAMHTSKQGMHTLQELHAGSNAKGRAPC